MSILLIFGLFLLFSALVFVLGKIVARIYCYFMKYPSLIVIVRHAESIRNKLMEGQRFIPEEESVKFLKDIADQDIPISPFGINQALVTGKKIKKKFGIFDAVYDSGYLRAKQTKDFLLKAYSKEELKNTEVISNFLIREREAGYVFLMTEAEAENNFGWHKKFLKTVGEFYSRPVGGESLSDVRDRVFLFLDYLFKKRAGEKILLVTHGHVIKNIRCILEDITDNEFLENFIIEPANCGVTVYEYEHFSGKLSLKSYDEIFWGSCDK